ncbi:hypothetical protein [Acidovorax sp. SUPP3334]|uniref:hypothetical protein n=1 Tax=Acidovorax sp. SUPP3334 TaxID=2920881 RepID=UPI0023DE2755|nr:hypothetical protein [Acidovorax sp. SUPP3334]GKT26027.1 hypothetical protein AVHM3334_19835 [Acidovorax sp. SUPP3334]
MSKKITGLQICAAIAKTAHGSMRRLDLALEIRLNPLNDWQLGIECAAIGVAVCEGLIVDVDADVGHGFVRICHLTDAGRHLLMTRITGTTARGILDEIEGEE